MQVKPFVVFNLSNGSCFCKECFDEWYKEAEKEYIKEDEYIKKMNEDWKNKAEEKRRKLDSGCYFECSNCSCLTVNEDKNTCNDWYYCPKCYANLLDIAKKYQLSDYNDQK
jgi:hypothetical protein